MRSGSRKGSSTSCPAAAFVGEALVAAPVIDMVSFTGSAGAGRRVRGCGGRHHASLVELGGKSREASSSTTPTSRRP